MRRRRALGSIQYVIARGPTSNVLGILLSQPSHPVPPSRGASHENAGASHWLPSPDARSRSLVGQLSGFPTLTLCNCLEFRYRGVLLAYVARLTACYATSDAIFLLKIIQLYSLISRNTKHLKYRTCRRCPRSNIQATYMYNATITGRSG